MLLPKRVEEIKKKKKIVKEHSKSRSISTYQSHFVSIGIFVRKSYINFSRDLAKLHYVSFLLAYKKKTMDWIGLHLTLRTICTPFDA